MSDKITEEHKNRESSFLKFLKKFINNIFIEQYPVTVELLKKSLWPISFICLAVFFSPEVRLIAKELSASISRTNQLTYGSLSLNFNADLGDYSPKDREAFEVIQKLNESDISIVLELAGLTLELRNMILTSEEETGLLSLHNYNLISFIRKSDNSEVELENADEVRQTELGKRVFAELQNIAISLLKNSSGSSNSQN